MDGLYKIDSAIEEYLAKYKDFNIVVSQDKKITPSLFGLEVDAQEEEIRLFLSGLTKVFKETGLLPMDKKTDTLWENFIKYGGSLKGLVKDDLPEGIWEKIARSVKLKKELVGYFFLQLRRYMLRYLAKNIEIKNNLNDECPFCGALPHIATLHQDEDGMRYLHCKECLTTWNYPRVKCPYCKETNHEHFQELHIDGKEKTFFEQCDKCGGVIKTFPKQKNTAFNPVTEDARTLYLDLLMQEEE